MRWGRSRTRRSSPASPISPIATAPRGAARPRWELATATAMARSAAGSWSLAPPTVATKTSLLAMRRRAWRWSTASTMSTRDDSTPDTVRRGRSSGEAVTSACTSASSGRRPSMVTATQVPETSWVWCSMKRPVGSVTAEIPSDDRSKQPTSSTGP